MNPADQNHQDHLLTGVPSGTQRARRVLVFFAARTAGLAVAELEPMALTASHATSIGTLPIIDHLFTGGKNLRRRRVRGRAGVVEVSVSLLSVIVDCRDPRRQAE